MCVCVLKWINYANAGEMIMQANKLHIVAGPQTHRINECICFQCVWGGILANYARILIFAKKQKKKIFSIFFFFLIWLLIIILLNIEIFKGMFVCVWVWECVVLSMQTNKLNKMNNLMHNSSMYLYLFINSDFRLLV